MASTNTPQQQQIPRSVKGTKELGDSGTYLWNGYISGEEYNFDLSGTRGLEIFDIMRRSDSTVHATLIVCKNPIISAGWDLEAGSDDPKDVSIRDFVKRELMGRNISFEDFLREGATSLDFGYSVFEIVYEPTTFNNKPYIGLQKLASRKQRSIEKWETDDRKPGIVQRRQVGSKQNVSIPREKLAIFTNEKEGDNYEGISLLRFAYKPWKIKDALDIMLAVALEKKAVGVPVIKKTVNTNQTTITETDLVRAREALRNLYANEESYLELPDSVDISMLDLSGTSTEEVLPVIQYHNTQITLSVLAQFLMLGSAGSSGSRAVSSDHSALFIKALEAVARMMQLTIQRDVINRLVDLNFTDVQNYPKLVFSGLSEDNIEAVSNAVSALMNSGALTRDPDIENRLRQMLGMPPLSEDDYENYDKTPVAKKDNPNNAPTPKDNDDNIDEIEEEAEETADDKKKKKTTASIVADAKRAQKRLIGELIEV